MNDENLIPFDKLSENERREMGRLGGIKSGEARRQKKDIYQLTNAILNAQLDGKKQAAVKQIAGDSVVGEDLTVNALMVAGQVKAAMNGNVKAFQCLTEYAQKSEKQADFDKRWNIPILDITTDFVEVYRAVHESFETGKYREIISKGGRGSIKSNFWAAIAEETIYNDPQAHVVYTRRYKTDLRGSVYNQFMKTVIRHDMIDEWDFTTSPMMARYKKTGQCVIFVGADKPISLKSYNLSFGYVKLLIHEECDEMAGLEQMDNIEDTFLRSDTFALDIKVFNPPKSANNFMNAYVEECRKKESTFICHSYYYNVPVPWLGKRFFERAEWFKQNKPKYYKNNYDGEVVGTGGSIFENLDFREITGAEINTFSHFYHGLDWGFSHPQAFIQCSYNEDTDTIYITDELRKVNMKQQSFAGKLKKYKNVEIIADSEAPDKISDWQDWGFDIIGATKRWKGGGRDYAWEWIQTVRKIVIDSDRTPFIAIEMKKAEHEVLKDGSFSSAYPKLDEDCICALIYSLNRVIIDSKKENNYVDYEEDDSDEIE